MCSEGADMEKELDRKLKGRADTQKGNPNIDRGWAWMVVLSSFLVHLLVMGSQMALGILNMQWLEEFNQSRGLTAWVSSLTMGITLIVGPFIGLFINTCGCRKTAMIGGFLTSLGWVLSAFATNVHFLFFTFGVMAGIGSGMVYLPAVVMVGQYFQKHRALAQGLSTTGTGFGTFLITVLLKYLCAEFGWRNAMIILGAISLNLCVCGALMRPLDNIEECSMETTGAHNETIEVSVLEVDAGKTNITLPEEGEDIAAPCCKEDASNGIVKKDMSKLGILKSLTRMTVTVRCGFWAWYSSYFGASSLFTNKVFVAFVVWALLAYCSFVIPFIHLPEIVELYGMTEQNNIFPLTSIIAIVHIFGKIFLGYIGDLSCVSAWNVFLASNFTLGICILILPLMQVYAALAVVCALIGFSSGYFSLMPVVTEDLVGIKQLANAYGIIICANGISALLGPPFAVNILKSKWKSLKDAFMRHKRKEREFRSGAAASAPSRYIHAEQLSFLIPCREMRSTDSSWEPTQRQEEEKATQATEPYASTGTQSPPPPNPTPLSTTPTLSAPPALAPARRRTILRPGRQRPEREEDRLIDALEAMSHPVPKLSCEAFFLLSLEDKMKKVPSSQQTELRDTLTRCIDAFIPPDGSTQQPIHPPQHATPMHTHTLPKRTSKHPCSIHTT